MTDQGIQEHLLNKNRLQQFTQRAKIPYPVYRTFNEGFVHLGKFRSTVVVDGKTFTSSSTFPSKKAAEQDVARIALEGICQRIKDCISSKTSDEAFPPIYEDRVFCKSILHEFAMKMNLEKPTYNTIRQEGVVPVFVSSLDFNGVTYTGEPSVAKKEAEQLAARAVILSILGSIGGNGGAQGDTLLSTIIKSKADRIFAVLKSSCTDVDKSASSMGLNSKHDNGVVASSEGFPADTNQTGTLTEDAAVEAFQGQSLDVSELSAPSHTGRLTENAAIEAFQGQFLDVSELSASSQAMLPPITLPQSSQVEHTLHGLASGGKRKCKKKKKVNKKINPELVNDVAGCNTPQLHVV